MNLLIAIDDNLGPLPLWAWIVIAVVIVAIIIIAVVLAKIVRANRRMMEGEQPQSPVEESKPEHSHVSASAAQTESAPAAQTRPAPTAQPKPDSAAKPKSVPASTPAQDEQKEQKEQKEQAKVYHITKRAADGKWQIKFNKGVKAIKLFDTQAEAIEYAKQLADNQEASIMIHKEDGTFRKLRYDKPNK